MNRTEEGTKQKRMKSWQYVRIMELLEDYWLTEPDEESIRVDMYFRHKNGQEQWKSIAWDNREGRNHGSDIESIYTLCG